MRSYTLQDVFSALRQHKESQKTEIMEQALRSDMDVALESRNKETASLEKVLRRSSETRAGNIVILCIGKRLFSYFQAWKDSKDEHKQFVQKKLKDKIYFHYKEKMQSYFLHWRKNSARKKIVKKRMVITQIEEETAQLERNSLEQKQELKHSRDAVSSM